MIVSKLNMILFTYNNDTNEYLIANYLINHKNWINTLKMVDIIKDTGVSKSTLTRFFKRIGYKSYTDVQYVLAQEKENKKSFKERDLDKHVINKLKDKKRIIVIGDSYSVSPLLVYQQKFLELGIDLEIKMSLQSYCNQIINKDFKDTDLLILISLYKSDLDLMAEFFNGYLELKQTIKEQQIAYLYVGKVATGNRDLDAFYKINDSDNFSDLIYQICYLFESIYNYYYL